MLAGYWSTRYFVLHYWSGYWPGFIVRGPGAGAEVKRKPPQAGGPAIVTDKQLTKVLVREAIEKLGAEEIQKAEIAAANEAFDRRQHFSELGKKGAEVKREKALAKEQQKKELLEMLEAGRKKHQEQQRKERAAPPRSETAQFVEQKKSDREKMSHLRALKRIAKEERRRRVGG